MNALIIGSGADVGVAFVGVWCLAALGGWYAGSAAYFFVASDRWLWKHLNNSRRALLCCVGTLVALLGVVLLPATLPCAYSAWCWHKSKALRHEKILFSLRSLSAMRGEMKRDTNKSCNIREAAAK